MNEDLVDVSVAITADDLRTSDRNSALDNPVGAAVNRLLIVPWEMRCTTRSYLFWNCKTRAWSMFQGSVEGTTRSYLFWNWKTGQGTEPRTLPPAVRDFLEDFDRGRPVDPAIFTLPIPRRLLREPARGVRG